MINVDRILGGIVQSVVSSALSKVVSHRTAAQIGQRLSRGVRRVDTRVLATGALGVAIAAYEEFSKEAGRTHTDARPVRPPPLPLKESASPPPLPVPLTDKDSSLSVRAYDGSPEALFLLRVMISAASVDGVIDNEEQDAVYDLLRRGGLTEEELSFLEGELQSPRGLVSLLEGVDNTMLLREAYCVAKLVTGEDSPAEQEFLDTIEERMNEGRI